MNKKQNEHILNEFFSENLTEEQKLEFQKRASSDPLFLREFIRRIELEEAFDDMFDTDEKSKSVVWYRKRKPIRIVTYTISAVAVLCCVIFFLFIQKNNSLPSGEDLFSEYYEPFDLGITRTSQGKYSTAYLYQQYILRDFKSLEGLSTENLDQRTSDDLVILVLAVAAIENEQFKKASKLLEQVNKDVDHYLIACYYKALLLIKKDCYVEAIPFLEAIMQNSLVFRTESSEILRLFAKNGIGKNSPPENF